MLGPTKLARKINIWLVFGGLAGRRHLIAQGEATTAFDGEPLFLRLGQVNYADIAGIAVTAC